MQQAQGDAGPANLTVEGGVAAPHGVGGQDGPALSPALRERGRGKGQETSEEDSGEQSLHTVPFYEGRPGGRAVGVVLRL
ncbi:hypothetical protein GCM10012319_04330 [Comamonas sp. KCTC 72670]|nr:hypothetical protein GCM10012319_04330 [Comamonas sp. KCTC 72670]